MKTEDDVYKEIEDYINSGKHNRPCTLQSIKKDFRTPRVIDLIFSHPDIFKIAAEFPHIPKEYRSEKILTQFVLGNPKRLALHDENGDLPRLIDEEEQTISVLIAFEFAKRAYERHYALEWGQYEQWYDGNHSHRGYAGKIPYTDKTKEYKDVIEEHCDIILNLLKENSHDINTISFSELAGIIVEYCMCNEIELKPTEKCELKYSKVNFKLSEKLVILVSGCPDAGKTTFSRMLSHCFQNSVCFDSDTSFNQSLSEAKDNAEVVVFSDLYADNSFPQEDLDNAYIVNIVISPSSVEKMYRNSKLMQHIPFDEYKKHEIDKYKYSRIPNPIHITNDYDDKIYIEVNKTIEEMARRLGVDLSPNSVGDSNYTKHLVSRNGAK